MKRSDLGSREEMGQKRMSTMVFYVCKKYI